MTGQHEKIQQTCTLATPHQAGQATNPAACESMVPFERHPGEPKTEPEIWKQPGPFYQTIKDFTCLDTAPTESLQKSSRLACAPETTNPTYAETRKLQSLSPSRGPCISLVPTRRYRPSRRSKTACSFLAGLREGRTCNSVSRTQLHRHAALGLVQKL